MDPDTCRARMIEKANVVLAMGEGNENAVELAEAVHDLDEWLRAGGFLPSVWTTQNPTGWPQIGRKKDVPGDRAREGT